MDQSIVAQIHEAAFGPHLLFLVGSALGGFLLLVFVFHSKTSGWQVNLCFFVLLVSNDFSKNHKIINYDG